jgi:hypothetical protein
MFSFTATHYQGNYKLAGLTEPDWKMLHDPIMADMLKEPHESELKSQTNQNFADGNKIFILVMHHVHTE